MILFLVGEQMFAISASAVTEIQNLQEMKPLASQMFRFGKVHHTLMRDGHRYWVVDANIHYSLAPSQSSRVLLLADSPVAVKVDSIARMAEISKVLPLPQSFQGDERNWYLGLTLIDGQVVPVVNPASFLSRLDMNALENTSSVYTGSTESMGAMA